MNTNFFPAADSAELSKRCAASLRATSDLIEAMTAGLPQEEQEALIRLLNGGGRVGIETTVDKAGDTRLCMVGFSGTGDRLVLSTVETPTTGLARH